MTAHEMHIAVRQGFQELDALRKRNIIPQQIDLALNQAVERVVEEAVEGHLTPFGMLVDFMNDMKNYNQVRTLIQLGPVLKVDEKFMLPENYMYMINVNTVYTGRIGNARFYDPLSFNRAAENPLHKAQIDSPLVTIQGEEIMLLPKNPDNVSMMYLKHPNKIALHKQTVPMIVAGEQVQVEVEAADCNLPKEVHQKIVDYAIEKLLLNVNSEATMLKTEHNRLQ